MFVFPKTKWVYHFALIVIFCIPVRAQVTQVWVAHYNGPSNSLDYARDMKLDAQGNIYVTGTSMGIGSGWDIVTVKYNPDGVQQWEARFNGVDNGDDWGYSIVVDSVGYSYVTGSTYSVQSGKDYVTIKYDNQGNQEWARVYDGPGNGIDEAVQVVLDERGNIIVTGSSQGLDTASDYATLKYNSSGNQIWVSRYNGESNLVDEGRALAVDLAGNVLVSGGSLDSTTDYDYVTIKYNPDGVEQWINRYDGPGHGYDVVYYAGSLVTDEEGNVIVTGYSTGQDSTYDYATLKYDSMGSLLWAARYNGSSQGTDYADALAIDQMGNIYVSGASFDSISNYDYLTVKYNSAGDLLWTASYNGSGNDWDEAYSIAIHPEGFVFITGRSVGAGMSQDYTTVMYSADGEEQWDITYDGSANSYDWPFQILLDSNQSIYVAGWSTENGSIADYTVVKYEYILGIDTEIQLSANDNYNVMLQNYPNPFNLETSIMYTLPYNGLVQLSIVDLSGRNIKLLQNTQTSDGVHIITWNVDQLPSGIYFCRLKIYETEITRRMILLK